MIDVRRSASPGIDVSVFGISVGVAMLFVLWGVLTGATAAVPFLLVMIGMCWSIFQALRGERALTRPTWASAPQRARSIEPTDPASRH